MNKCNTNTKVNKHKNAQLNDWFGFNNQKSQTMNNNYRAYFKHGKMKASTSQTIWCLRVCVWQLSHTSPRTSVIHLSLLKIISFVMFVFHFVFWICWCVWKILFTLLSCAVWLLICEFSIPCEIFHCWLCIYLFWCCMIGCGCWWQCWCVCWCVWSRYACLSREEDSCEWSPRV